MTSNLFEETYFLEIYENGYSFEYHYPIMKALADILIKLCKPEKVLDIGCAKGYLVKAFLENGVDTIGIDISEYAVRHSVTPNLLLMSATNLGYKPETLDLITALHVAEHLHNPLLLIEEVRRCLKTGGYFVMITPTPEGDKKRKTPDPTHVSVLPEREWVAMFNGFERVKYFEKKIRRYVAKCVSRDHANMYVKNSPKSFIGKFLQTFGIRENAIRVYLLLKFYLIEWRKDQYIFVLRKV